MSTKHTEQPIKHILCPTDLSPNSQKALGFAAALADDLSAELTACHVVRAQWFATNIETYSDDGEIAAKMRNPIVGAAGRSGSTLKWRASVIDNSFDPSRDILSLARETGVDLIVMKARPGVMSAFRFGSIVERVVAASACPVLLFPTRFLTAREPGIDGLHFRHILFDYDFSQATDDLYRVARGLSDGLSADMQVLSVLEPPEDGVHEFAGVGDGRDVLSRAIEQKLHNVLMAGAPAGASVRTAVEWGEHARTVLEYADTYHTDLLCTTLAPPHFSYEKFYSVYLGQLLKSAKCPILVKQSV